MSLLCADELSVHFGGVKAVQEVTFSVEAGEVFSIVGPNGAGKTTIFNLISRIYDVTHGTVTFDEQDITNVPTHRVAELGIVRTFQNTELFEQETVLNNLLIGCHIHRKTGLLSELLFLPGVRTQELAFRRVVEDVIDLLDLQSYRDQVIANLPYGVRKMVEIARALLHRPRLILCDEATVGLDVKSRTDIVADMHVMAAEEGVGVLWATHLTDEIEDKDRLLVLHRGRLLADTTGAMFRGEASLSDAFLAATGEGAA